MLVLDPNRASRAPGTSQTHHSRGPSWGPSWTATRMRWVDRYVSGAGLVSKLSSSWTEHAAPFLVCRPSRRSPRSCSSFANLGLSLETHDWQRLKHALSIMFSNGEVRVEAVTSVVWSGAVWGRLDDPSTLDVIKAIRTRAEQSPRLAESLESLGTQKVHQAIAQVR
jgi:hypothetical protein